MNNNIRVIPESMIDVDEADFDFADEVKSRSGVNVDLCWHCRSCAGGCPFAGAMDMAPNNVIRLVQLGLKDEALDCTAIWICVGCHTCAIQCPQAIDIAVFMDTLREISIEEDREIAEPEVRGFHKEVLNSIERYGRTHKLEIMLRYKIKQRNWFQDMDVGLKMLAKQKLDLLPSKISSIEDIKKLFRK